MAYLARARKDDLRTLADEMGLILDQGLKISQIIDQILKSPQYDEEIVKALLSNVTEERKSKEVEDNLVKEREFELQKLKLNLEAQKNCIENGIPPATSDEMPKFELKKLIPSFDSKEGDMALYLNLFERQMIFLNIADTKWVSYLIGVLPPDVAKLIARESEEDSKNYQHVKTMLLKRYKLSAEKFRQLFATHRKSSERTYRDFYFELRDYFEGWLEALNVQTFEDLKSLVIADQMKKRTPEEFRNHFINEWSDWNSPEELAEKLDEYDNVRSTLKRDGLSKKSYASNSKSELSRHPPSSKNRFSPRSDKSSNDVQDRRFTRVCYGCGEPGVIKSRCSKCNPSSTQSSPRFGNVTFQSCSATTTQIALLNITVNGLYGTACADSGASHCIAGEILYKLLKQEGVDFQKTQLTMSLADGTKNEVEAYTTCVDIELEGRIIKTNLIALPHAKQNRTLLGTDFLQEAGIVLDLKRRIWFFDDCPRQKFEFAEDVNLCNMNTLVSESNPCQLREDEGIQLLSEEKDKLNALLKQYETSFEPGGEATPYVKHHINTGDHHPISVVPYRLSPSKKEELKKRRKAVPYSPGDRVWVTTHVKSNKANQKSAKFTPKRDGPYIVTTQRSLTSYEVADPNNPDVPLGTYHTSALRPCHESHSNSQPVQPLRRRGRPKKN